MAISSSNSPAPTAARQRPWSWIAPVAAPVAAHRSAPREIEQIEREDLAVERRKAALPARHVALPAAPHACRGSTRRRRHRSRIVSVRSGAAEIGFALGVVAMAGDAIGGEHRLAGVDFRGGHVLCDGGIGKAAHVSHDVVDFGLLEHLIAAEGHHLRGPGLRMRRIDADADGFGDAFGIAAPQPRRRRQVREAVAALRVRSMTRRAIVAEQRPAGLPHDLHQSRIGLDVLEALGLDALGPDAAFESRLLQRFQRRCCAGRCRAGPWCRSRRAARPASAPSRRRRTRPSRSGRNRPAAGTGVFSSLMPFHS